jgi:hypothetical protein
LERCKACGKDQGGFFSTEKPIILPTKTKPRSHQETEWPEIPRDQLAETPATTAETLQNLSATRKSHCEETVLRSGLIQSLFVEKLTQAMAKGSVTPVVPASQWSKIRINRPSLTAAI